MSSKRFSGRFGAKREYDTVQDNRNGIYPSFGDKDRFFNSTETSKKDRQVFHDTARLGNFIRTEPETSSRYLSSNRARRSSEKPAEKDYLRPTYSGPTLDHRRKVDINGIGSTSRYSETLPDQYGRRSELRDLNSGTDSAFNAYSNQNKYRTNIDIKTKLDSSSTSRPDNRRNKYLLSPIKALPSRFNTNKVEPRGLYKSVDPDPKSGIILTKNRIQKKRPSPADDKHGLFSRLRGYLSNFNLEKHETDDSNVEDLKNLLGHSNRESYRDVSYPAHRESKRVSFEPQPSNLTDLGRHDYTTGEARTRGEELSRYNQLEQKYTEDIRILEQKHSTTINELNIIIRDLEYSGKKSRDLLQKREEEETVKIRTLEKENFEISQKNRELSLELESLRKEIDYERHEITARERKVKNQTAELDEKSQKLADLELSLDSLKSSLEYRNKELVEKESEIRNLEIQNEIKVKLTSIKEKYENERFNTSKESLRINAAISQNLDEYRRIRKFLGYTIAPIDTQLLKADEIFDTISGKIDKEISFLKTRNIDGNVTVEQIDNSIANAFFQELNDHLQSAKAKKDAKVKELTSTLLVLNPKTNSSVDEAARIRKLYLKKHKLLFKMNIINELCAKIKLLFEYRADGDVLQSFSSKGLPNLGGYYQKLKREIDGKYI